MKALKFPIEKIEEQISENLTRHELQVFVGTGKPWRNWVAHDTVERTTKQCLEIDKYKQDMHRQKHSSISINMEVDPTAGRIMNMLHSVYLHAFRMDCMGSTDWVWRNSENNEMFNNLSIEKNSDEYREASKSAHEMAERKFAELYSVDAVNLIESQKTRINQALAKQGWGA